jgi:hypothetical protein
VFPSVPLLRWTSINWVLICSIIGEMIRSLTTAPTNLVKKFYDVRTVHFGMKLYNDQRNAQVFNLFIYLHLPYMFRAFFQPIFRGTCTSSAVVEVSWALFQSPGADIVHRRLEPLPK